MPALSAPPPASLYPLARQSLSEVTAFLRELGQALHISGAPAQVLENRLVSVGKQLGVRVEGFAVLTFLALTVAAPDGQRQVEMLRLPAYDYNMARLIALESLCHELSDPKQLPAYAAQLAEIMRQPPPWAGWRLAIQGFLLSAAVAALLRGGWVEILCGGLIGLLFVAAHQRLKQIQGLGPAIPVMLCALAAMLAQGLNAVLPQQSPFIAAVAGVVLLLPGFTLTVAMSELATENFLAGTGRLAGAFMLLFLMGAGLVIGTKISLAVLPIQPPSPIAALPAWAIWPMLALLGIALLGVIQAPLSAIYVATGACLLAWAVYSLFSAAAGNVVGAFAGALAVATAGNLYQYLTRRPAVLLQIPGLIALVPGSMGFRGLHALIEQDSATGMPLITDMLLTGAALAIGMLLADNLAGSLMARFAAPLAKKTQGGANAA